MEIALLSGGDAMTFWFRWIHFLAGVAWIGLLYYFNFVQGEWFKETDAAAKSAAVQKLVPRALWWFRWGAMATWLSGLAILMYKGHQAGFEIFTTSWGVFILAGGALGTLMFLNVWLVIWPNQKIIIASTIATAGGGQADPRAAAAGPKAALASRSNTLFSVPMLFFMGAASHLPLGMDPEYNGMLLTIVLAVVILGLEFNALKGKMGPMASVKGVIGSGFGLTAVLYAVIEILT